MYGQLGSSAAKSTITVQSRSKVLRQGFSLANCSGVWPEVIYNTSAGTLPRALKFMVEWHHNVVQSLAQCNVVQYNEVQRSGSFTDMTAKACTGG